MTRFRPTGFLTAVQADRFSDHRFSDHGLLTSSLAQRSDYATACAPDLVPTWVSQYYAQSLRSGLVVPKWKLWGEADHAASRRLVCEGADGAVRLVNKRETLRSNLFGDRRLILGGDDRWRDVAGEQPTRDPGDECKSNNECLVH